LVARSDGKPDSTLPDRALGVNFQKVVHSVLRMSADVAKRH
jgi:hypothetical protein